MSQQPTPEFVLGLRAMMLDGFKNDVEITKKVIAAIPDAKSDYRPDPKARTAKELAWHMANTDVQFLDGIADLKFTMENPEHKPGNDGRSGGLVRREREARDRARGGDDGRAVAHAGQLLRRVQYAVGLLSGIPQQPQHPSPGRAGDVPAAHGIEGAVDLWWQLRRALPAAGGGRDLRRRLLDRCREAARDGRLFCCGRLLLTSCGCRGSTGLRRIAR